MQWLAICSMALLLIGSDKRQHQLASQTETYPLNKIVVGPENSTDSHGSKADKSTALEPKPIGRSPLEFLFQSTVDRTILDLELVNKVDVFATWILCVHQSE